MPLTEMATNVQSDVHSKRFALRIATMIDSRLIWYKHYYRWADQLIAELDAPPNWILEIATVKYFPDAVAAVNRFVYSEPFESFDGEEFADEQVACLYFRYRTGAISWASFLSKAGVLVDAHNGRRCCEYFYAFLNELEDNKYSRNIERRQTEQIEGEFAKAISVIAPLHKMFMGHFREYVANEA